MNTQIRSLKKVYLGQIIMNILYGCQKRFPKTTTVLPSPNKHHKIPSNPHFGPVSLVDVPLQTRPSPFDCVRMNTSLRILEILGMVRRSLRRVLTPAVFLLA